MDTSFRALTERVAVEYPESWLPETKDGHPNPLVGEVTDRREAMTRRDSVETVLVVRDADGTEWSLWLLGAVLQRELAEAGVGDRVAVRWIGMRTNAEGSPYRSYRVARDPAVAEKSRRKGQSA